MTTNPGFKPSLLVIILASSVKTIWVRCKRACGNDKKNGITKNALVDEPYLGP
jgi:hypothetical protein